MFITKFKKTQCFVYGSGSNVTLKEGHDDGDGSAHNCKQLCSRTLEGS